MSISITLVPGRYYAGINRPFYVSQGMVSSAMKDAGFTNLAWHDRDKGPPPVNPKLDPGYKDNWDEWISVDMPTNKVVELPGRPSWIVAAPSAPPVPKNPLTGRPVPSARAPANDVPPQALSIVEKPDSQNGFALFVGASLIAIAVRHGRRKGK